MGMFNNYTTDSTQVPDNRIRCLKVEKLDEIVVGGTAMHTFKLTFSFSQLCNKFEVFYNQSITPILTIDSTALGAPYQIVEENGKTLITITLSPENTIKFDTKRLTFAQIKLYMKDNSVIFGDINKIKVLPTLKKNN